MRFILRAPARTSNNLSARAARRPSSPRAKLLWKGVGTTDWRTAGSGRLDAAAEQSILATMQGRRRSCLAWTKTSTAGERTARRKS